MRKTITLFSSLLFVSSMAFGEARQKTFMPANDLDQEDGFMAGGLTEAQFNAVIDRAEKIYQPIFSQFGAKLTVERRWSDATVNASANQTGNNWQVHMYGGLARRPEVTEDGFAMVVCHEIGHHLAGYPFVEAWAANEGQSDIYATGACAMKVFAPNAELSFRAQSELPADVKAKCDASRPEGERDNCYRALAAGKSLADLLGALNSETVSFSTPDTRVVSKTNNQHPAAQCRLDTYVAGALCGTAKWDHKVIPGKSATQRNSLEAQEDAFAHSCADGAGARPRCWFATLTENPAPGQDCPLGNPVLCSFACQLDPTLPWCSSVAEN